MSTTSDSAFPLSSLPSGRMVLSGVTVVDTRTGSLAANQSVVLEGGKIQQIVPAGFSIEGATHSIDAQGKFVVPGYLDMHTHVLQEEHATAESAALMLAYGITGIRHLAGTPEILRARREGTLTMGEHAPELLSLAGEILIPLNAPTPEAGVAEVKRQKAAGADFIKTIFVTPKTFFATLEEAKRQDMLYDGHMSPGVDLTAAAKAGMGCIEHMGPTEMTLIATSTKGWLINFILKMKPPKPPDMTPEAMKKAGRIMIANPILGRLSADPDALTKTQRLIDSYSQSKANKLGESFAQYGTWQCPTLIRDATMRMGDDPLYTQSSDLRYVTPSTRAFWSSVAKMYTAKVPADKRDTLRKLGDMELTLARTFDETGVKMIAGSDFGGGWVVPGVSLHQEYDLLAEAGLSPLKVLQMTTLNGAEFLGRQSSMGTVEAGKDANLVLLDANPIESVQNLHKVHAVVREGAFYSAGALDALKEHAAGRIAGDEPDELEAADQVIP